MHRRCARSRSGSTTGTTSTSTTRVTCSGRRGTVSRGLSRRALLSLLHRRCRELRVGLHFEADVAPASARVPANRPGDPEAHLDADLTAHLDADLVIGADGINSTVRERFAERPSNLRSTCGRTASSGWARRGPSPPSPSTSARTSTDCGACTPTSTTRRPSPPSSSKPPNETWRRAGMDAASEEETVCFLSRLFAGGAGRASAHSQPFPVAAVSHDRQRAMVGGERGADRGCGAHGALLGGLGDPAGDAGCDCAGEGDGDGDIRGHAWRGRKADGGGVWPRPWPPTKRKRPPPGGVAAAGGARQPPVVRGHRALLSVWSPPSSPSRC